MKTTLFFAAVCIMFAVPFILVSSDSLLCYILLAIYVVFLCGIPTKYWDKIRLLSERIFNVWFPRD